MSQSESADSPVKFPLPEEIKREFGSDLDEIDFSEDSSIGIGSVWRKPVAFKKKPGSPMKTFDSGTLSRYVKKVKKEEAVSPKAVKPHEMSEESDGSSPSDCMSGDDGVKSTLEPPPALEESPVDDGPQPERSVMSKKTNANSAHRTHIDDSKSTIGNAPVKTPKRSLPNETVQQKSLAQRDSASFADSEASSLFDEYIGDLSNTMTDVSKLIFSTGAPSEGVIFKEELEDDDYEFYTIQCPRELNVKLLSKKVINLDGESELVLETDTEGANKYEVFSENENCERNVNVILPSSTSKGFKLVSLPLSGTIIISEPALMEPIEMKEKICKEDKRVPLPDFISKKHPSLAREEEDENRRTEKAWQAETEPFEYKSVKKKKKKEQKQGTMEALPQTSSFNSDEEGNIKKKKVKKEKITEAVPQTSIFETDEEGTLIKKKVKKEKITEAVPKTSIFEMDEEGILIKKKVKKEKNTEAIPLNKVFEMEGEVDEHLKKKKKKKRETHEDMLGESFVTHTEQQAGIKLKKSKKDHKEEERPLETELPGLLTEVGQEEWKKKNKKKKKESVEGPAAREDVQADLNLEESVQKKKKRKRKSSGSSDVSLEKFKLSTFSHIQEGKSKKKKKKKKKRLLSDEF